MFRLLSLVALLLLSTQAFSHGMSPADQARILNAGYMEFVALGAKHMITGYDHLLFLFGVIFFLTRFKDVVKLVTAFTLGHSITLVFATLMSIKANYYLIDAVIALTVCYKAFDNLDGFKKYLQMQSPSMIAMVFIFGLIHGFGLSTRLQQLPLGTDGLVAKILSFNIGVELGQIAALCVMVLLISGWRKTRSFTQFSGAANVALLIVGSLLLLMQLHGYQHTKYPDDFPLNADDHSHIHADMEREKSAISNYSKPLDLESTDEPEEPETHSHDGVNYHSH
jgi:hypothetical protein